MPIYTYRCKNCGIQFDQRQKFSDQPLVRCPECSKKTLQKVYQPVGIVFKGSGFYATDNRSPSGSNRSGSSSKSEGEDKKTDSGESKSSSESSTTKAKETKENASAKKD